MRDGLLALADFFSTLLVSHYHGEAKSHCAGDRRGRVFVAIVVLENGRPGERCRRVRICVADSVGCNSAQSQPDARDSGGLYRGDLYGVDATDQAGAVSVGGNQSQLWSQECSWS